MGRPAAAKGMHGPGRNTHTQACSSQRRAVSNRQVAMTRWAVIRRPVRIRWYLTMAVL